MKVIPSGYKSLIVDYDENLKSHLRIFDDADEALITSYIRSAGEYIEKYIGLPILSNQFTVMDMLKISQLNCQRVRFRCKQFKRGSRTVHGWR
jgi:hypothetical protein